MDYNNGNNGNGQGLQGRYVPGQGNPNQAGMPGQPGMPPQGMMRPGMQGQPGMPPQGMVRPGMPGQPGMPPQGMARPGMPGQPGMPPQGMMRPGMQGQPGMPPQGMVRPGMPGQPGMPPQGMVRPGMPGQSGMPPQGMPGQGIGGSAPQGRGMFGSANAGKPASNTDAVSARLAKGIEDSISEKGREREPAKLFGDGFKGKLPSFSIPSGLTDGLTAYAPYIFGAILVLCLIISLAAYGKGHKSSGKSYNIPKDMVTYSGVFKNAYEKAASGALGSGTVANMGATYNDDGTEVPAAPTAVGEDPMAEDVSGSDDAGSSSSSSSSSSDSTGEVTGAAMVLDDGSSSGGQAESYKELLSQLDSAIASGDTAFVGSKLAYEDENGNLKGYPQSVVDHFVTYMSANSDKRSTLMTELSDDKYSGQNNNAFVVKLPLIKFVVNMGYDNTTVSISGFSDQLVNAGQSADIAPLLPCMYTLTISNPEWPESTTRDIEANVSEPTISINIKP